MADLEWWFRVVGDPHGRRQLFADRAAAVAAAVAHNETTGEEVQAGYTRVGIDTAVAWLAARRWLVAVTGRFPDHEELEQVADPQRLELRVATETRLEFEVRVPDEEEAKALVWRFLSRTLFRSSAAYDDFDTSQITLGPAAGGSAALGATPASRGDRASSLPHPPGCGNAGVA